MQCNASINFVKGKAGNKTANNNYELTTIIFNQPTTLSAQEFNHRATYNNIIKRAQIIYISEFILLFHKIYRRKFNHYFQLI